MRFRVALFTGLTICSSCMGSLLAEAPRSREFQFVYAATVTEVPAGEKARIWVPVPPTNDDQSVKIDPVKGRLGQESKFGNKMLYLESTPDKDGQIAISVTYHVRRQEVQGDTRSGHVTQEEAQRFLQADSKVPVGGKSLQLISDQELPSDQLGVARLLYDVVNHHMTYSKQGTGWGQGDSEWACDSRYGNCSDFHSLFISLARAQKMPAKFEMGFPLPEKRGSGEIPGYHCWAKFRPTGRGWIPVDISEANKVKDKDPDRVEYYFGNLTENRVVFSVGRDITLEPHQAGPPLNYFVYPYVEVGGKPYPAEKIQRKFTYQDVDVPQANQ